MYSETTKKINITVEPFYLEDQSEPINNHYVWAYKIIINNLSNDTVQLKNRYWKIIDSNGVENEVRGPGVIGEQPIIKPGEKYEYVSGAPLTTPSGFMQGHYEMINNDGKNFDVKIPLFPLDIPDERNLVH